MISHSWSHSLTAPPACLPFTPQLAPPSRRPGVMRAYEDLRPRRMLAQPLQVAADHTVEGKSTVPPVTHAQVEVPVPRPVAAPAGPGLVEAGLRGRAAGE